MLSELALILTLATVLALFLQKLRLPIVLGYILTGIIVGVFSQFAQLHSLLELLGGLGIAFLLFLVGIELDFKELKEVGPVSLIVGIGQVLVTSGVGFLLAHLVFNFSRLVSIYIAIALTFSSTIIIVKLLGEKGDLNSLYGRISVGMLLVQDLIAILALIFLASLGQGTSNWVGGGVGLVGLTVLKGILLVGLAFLVAWVITPWFFASNTNSSDLILIGSISWAVLFSFFAQKVGFTLEVGAFLAGLALAGSPYNVEISAKVKPLRDFFIILFFIFLGMSMSLDSFSALWVPALVFSVFVLLGNPIILLSLMGLMGYHRRVSFLTGLTVAQISEFSLVVVAMGQKLGHLDNSVVSMVTVVGIITITLSSYLIQQGDRIYQRLEGWLRYFQRHKLRYPRRDAKGYLASGEGHAILFGLGRMGQEFARKLKWLGVPVLGVDYDPRVIGLGAKRTDPGRIKLVYGDAGDAEILSSLNVESARLLICTVPDFETNLFVVERARRLNENLIIIARASNAAQARQLRQLGAGFVIIPEVVAAHAVSKILEEVRL